MTEPAAPRAEPPRFRRSGALALALGIAALLAAGLFAWQRQQPPAREIRLTAGFAGTTRSVVAEALAKQIERHGIRCTIVPTESSHDEVATLIAGRADLAMISDAYRIPPEVAIRVVAPLQLEALHLLVKQELADAVTADLAALDGHTVDLGPRRSATEELARDVLDFAEVRDAAPGKPGIRPLDEDVDALADRIGRGDRAALPDAVFHLGTVPSLVVRDLVRHAGYRLVPLPFAEALRLSAVIPPDATDAAANPEWKAGRRRLIAEVVLPPYVYETVPAVPAAPLPTIGARLHLVARTDVSVATVEAVLGAVFEPHFARLLHPPLDREAIGRLPQSELHPGAIAFLARSQSAITNETFDQLSNTLSVAGALFGGVAFLAQGWRQRRAAHRDAIVAEHLQRVIGLERRVTEIELASGIELDELIAVQRQILQLKAETLDRFTRGEIDGRSTLADLLTPIRALGDHVGELLLHVRDNLEDQARAEGREAADVWDEAAEGSDEPGKR